jgi:hypothetical protein
MLSIFCRKSIHALAGTTVDNFATQVLSPKIGAVEYTVTDMGFPVYANAYGIYTLAQTNQYGDYLGTPMSQDVSPWLRPRLVRKLTSPKEVVVAWPVRSKNQYRLAFSDGYVLTMTMNNGTQQAPTFSKQKYFTEDEDTGPTTPLLEYPAMVPAAVSSELDDGGEERIHIAPKQPPVLVATNPVCVEAPIPAWGGSGTNDQLAQAELINAPSWLNTTDNPNILFDFFDNGEFAEYVSEVSGIWQLNEGSTLIEGPIAGHGTIYTADMTQSVCVDWEIGGGT